MRVNYMALQERVSHISRVQYGGVVLLQVRSTIGIQGDLERLTICSGYWRDRKLCCICIRACDIGHAAGSAECVDRVCCA